MHIKNLHEKNVSRDSYKINPQENVCLDCTQYYCKLCVKIINIKSDMDKALQTGILEKELDQNEFICKACFKKWSLRRVRSFTSRRNC